MKKPAPVKKKAAAPRVRRTKPAATPRQPTNRLLAVIVAALDAKKTEDVRVYDVRRLSSITDFLVVGTVLAEPHLRALRIELEKVIDAERSPIAGIDMTKGSGWTVVDAFEVMVHLFTVENREKYRLDLLWKDAVELPVADLLPRTS